MVSTLPFTKTISLFHHDTMSWWMKVRSPWQNWPSPDRQGHTLWIAVPKKIEHDRTVISHDNFSMILLFYLFELFLFDAASGITCGFWAKTHQENAPPQLTFINAHPPILPPVRDGDSDSTTTPGTDFPWKLAKRAPGFKWTLGCPGHFPYLGTFYRVCDYGSMGGPMIGNRGKSHHRNSEPIGDMKG